MITEICFKDWFVQLVNNGQTEHFSWPFGQTGIQDFITR